MIKLKSPREISLMRDAGRVVAKALDQVRQKAVPGATTAELNETVASVFREHGATPLFLGVPSSVKGKPSFPAVVCASLNEQVVHGIPSRRVLREGDILSIDTGCKLNGWCGDAAVTLPIGTVSPEIQRLLDVTSKTLTIAIEAMGRCRT
jgi:methionyl aminopeptidase